MAKKVALALLLASFAFLVLPVLAAAIIDFEDAAPGTDSGALAYPGVSFSGTDWAIYVGGPLPAQHLFGSCSSALTVSFAANQQNVSFIWASVNNNLLVEAYLDGNFVSSQNFVGPYGSFASVSGDFDQLVIGGGSEGGCATIDDLTYDYEGANACRYPLPVGASVYNVPAGALAYYAADPSTYAGFNLPPGTWYISEFGESFAKVWVACDASPVWIPVENVVR